MKSVAAIAVLTGLLLLPASRASAQTDFSGTWTLDRDLSADLTKASFDPPAAAKPRSTGGLSGGFGPFGFGGGGGRGGGSHGGGGSRPSGGSGESSDGSGDSSDGSDGDGGDDDRDGNGGRRRRPSRDNDRRCNRSTLLLLVHSHTYHTCILTLSHHHLSLHYFYTLDPSWRSQTTRIDISTFNRSTLDSRLSTLTLHHRYRSCATR